MTEPRFSIHRDKHKDLMNYLISFLLKFPVFYIVVNGLAALTGLNIWWCVPICVIVMLSYDISEMVRKKL